MKKDHLLTSEYEVALYVEMDQLRDNVFNSLSPKERAAILDDFEGYLNLTLDENDKMEMDQND